MEAETVDGWWWLPGRNADARYGRLAAGTSGSWVLEAFGSLEENHSDLSGWFRGDGETRTAPVIHGHLVKGAGQPRFVSLLDCWQSGANRTLAGPVPGARTESWTFQEVVHGHDSVSPDENAVEVQVRLSNLVDWSGRRPPQVEWSDDRVSASATSIDVGSAAVPGATIDLVLDHGATQSEMEAIVRHEAMFRVTPSNPVTFHSAMSEFAIPLRALLSFLTLGHVDVESLRLRLEAGPDDRWPRWFDYRTRLQRPFEEPKVPVRHEMLATWPDLGRSCPFRGSSAVGSSCTGRWRRPSHSSSFRTMRRTCTPTTTS